MMHKYVCIFVFFACAGLSSCSNVGSATKVDASSKGNGASAQNSNASNNHAGPDASAKGAARASDSVQIALADQQRVGITVAPVEVRTVPRTLSVAAQVQMDEQHTSHVGAIADGIITSVNVLPGAVVRKGTVLGGIHSHMVHETVGALVQAFAAVDRERAAVTFAEQALDRYNHLYSIQAASLEESQRSEQNLLQAKNLLIDAEATVRMEREHLSELLQVSPESLTPGTLYDREIVPIRSVMDGVVIARNVTVGQVVNTGFETFVVSNLSSVWVTAAVNESNLSQIHQGASANVITQAYPGEAFPGRIAMVGDTLDPQTRTVPVRIVVPNPGARLRPGMFATAQITEPQTQDAVFVPEDALQDINGMQVVFVTQDGTTFRPQIVTVGTRAAGKAEILDGLRRGDRIAAAGAFVVKSAMLKGTMGEG
jgi:multidrug efflux pump subunit AcrA (membrane-fusion protein)